MIFKHVKGEKEMHKSVLNKLIVTCKQNYVEIPEKAKPKLFSRFVHSFKQPKEVHNKFFCFYFFWKAAS